MKFQKYKRSKEGIINLLFSSPDFNNHFIYNPFTKTSVLILSTSIGYIFPNQIWTVY